MSWSELTIFFPLPFEEIEVIDELIEESWSVLFVIAECPKKDKETQATLASNAGTSSDVLAWLLLNIELDPFTAVWVDRSGYELVLCEVTQAVTLARLEDDAR